MNITDFFVAISKHCRCGFNSLSSRCKREKPEWKRNRKTNRNGLSKIVAFVLNRKWTVNVLNKYFRPRTKMHKTKINSKQPISKSEFEEKLETITVNNVCANLSDSFQNDEAWRSIFVDLTKKGSMTYLIFLDQKTLYPEVFELGVRSLWKQTKRAFRDVFREYRIPVEIHTSAKVFFVSGKFVRFMNDHGIVTAIKSDAENSLTNVLASVKVLIHNSRFWHEELRKLRETISKSLLVKEDKYVQVGDVSDEDMKFSMSDSSSGDSSDCGNDIFGPVIGKYKNYSKAISTVKERPMNNPHLLTKRKEMIDRRGVNMDLVRINEKEFDWMYCLRGLRIKTDKYQKKRFINKTSNKIKTTVDDINKYDPIKMSLERNMTRIEHCAHYHTYIPDSWAKNIQEEKINNNYHSYQNLDLMFHEDYDEMLNYLRRSNSAESKSSDENNFTINSSGSSKVVFKLGKKGSGDNCSISGDVPMLTSSERNGITSKENLLIRFPIEILPFKYDNLFITEKDLDWKAVVVDVIELPSMCFYMFIDCATKFPELFLQINNKGIPHVKFLINALCLLWQIHGKPIEIHSPKGSIFSSTKLCRFIDKYDMFFYYDSPFLRNDMKIGHVWMEYKNILGKGNVYPELLRIQRNVRKIVNERSKREAGKKRQKTLFSLNKTTIVDAKGHLATMAVEGILQKDTTDFTQHIPWRKIAVDEVHSNDHYYIIFIDIETFYPELKEIEFGSKLHFAKLLIKTFRNFFHEKSRCAEIHVVDRKPFKLKGVIRSMERIGVSYYRQSRYFNGGNCVQKCLQHMKSLICQSADLDSAIYNCRKKLLPWLGLYPQHLTNGSSENPFFDPVVPPWAEIIIDIFSHGDMCYLVILDYDSLYPECFPIRRNIFTNVPVKIIRACERAFSVLGCPSRIWTFDRDFSRSELFLKFLRTRDIQQFFLTSHKERETSSMLASFRQKLAMTGSFYSALAATREGYCHSLGACPVRRLREKETAVNEALQAPSRQRKHVRFNLPGSRTEDLSSGESDEND